MNTLILWDETGKELFSSDKHGLRPLLQCVDSVTQKSCKLRDKVVGLAAARIIVYSGIIAEVETPVCSIAAKELLEQKNIKITAEKVVDNILNNDKTSICPMEKRATEADNEQFYIQTRKLLMIA